MGEKAWLIGAGASVDMGYPTGKRLIEMIAGVLKPGKKKGKYQPWSLNGPGGIKDSFQDISNTAQGARGEPLQIGDKYYDGQ